MRLVIDTNIIISALIRDSLTRKMLIFPGIKLYTPEITFKEIENNIDVLIAKSNLPKENIIQILDVLKKNIETESDSRWEKFYNQAKVLIGEKDPKDVPFVAVAFALTVDGIWSNDKVFQSQTVLKVWDTAELALNLGFIKGKK